MITLPYLYFIPKICQRRYAAGLPQPLTTHPPLTSSRFLTLFHHTHDPIPVEGWDCDSGPMGLPWGYIDGVVHHTHDPIPYPIPYKLAKS